MRAAYTIAAVIGIAAPLGAQQQLSVQQFEAETAGKTLYTRGTNFSYGAEHHFANRRVTLLFTDGQCMSGRWEPRGDQICYTYLQEPGRWHCWTYHDTGGAGRMFKLLNDDVTPPRITELDVVKTDTKPLHCETEFFGAGYVPSSNREP